MPRLLATYRNFSPAILLLALCLAAPASAEVRITPTPDDGLQPRLVTDAGGSLHLLYFRKRSESRGVREGNLYYRPYLADAGRFGIPVRVSSQAFALQSYAINRAAMAVDGSGRVHVLWYVPRDSAFYYSRSNPERTAFEAQRSMVITFAEGLDAGGDVAAFEDNVAITWGAGDLSREHARTMFARLSTDGGASFGRETSISDPALGACACCSMAAEYLDESSLLVAYRSAIDGVGRHMQLLTITHFTNEPTSSAYGPVRPLQEWEASFCPLSTNDIGGNAESSPWLVFETEARIVRMPLPAGEPLAVAEPFIETRQKNPAIAFNAAGEHLVVWGEAISHTRGGRLNMRLFAGDSPVPSFDFQEEIRIPDFSFPAAAALPDGDFLVLY